MDKKKHWFKRRRFGYGWVPTTKQGWLVVLVYLALLLGGAAAVSDVPKNEFNKEVGFYLLAILLATITLIKITYKKGPTPRWRWGKKPSDNPDEDW